MSISATPHQILKKYFGFDDFRSGQLEIINAIIHHQDTLAIKPTGSGKSLCFQIPALYFSGTTLVISPLISLMSDQVSKLKSLGIRATYLNSTLSPVEIQQRLTKLKQHHYQLVYLAPERLNSQKFKHLLTQCSINFVAIDEAHCVSMWGHDFRPSYKNIAKLIKQLQPRPIMAAFTATATNLIKQDIINLLNLQNPVLFKQSSLRTNLQLRLVRCQSRGEKQVKLIKLLKLHANQSGIIYCATRKSTELLSGLINQLNFREQLSGKPVHAYHGGLSAEQRQQVQENFINHRTDLICATNAFGMGIDKNDIRFVVHYQLPANIENYYQEVGRAGRDEKTSCCYLLFSPADVVIQQSLIQTKNKQQARLKQQKLDQIINLARSHKCFQQQIALYFDESIDKNCETCSNCTHWELSLTEVERDCFNLIQINSVLTNIPYQTQYYLSLLNPQNKQEWYQIPGIGLGLIKQLKSYNL